jgi:hypothetical protein
MLLPYIVIMEEFTVASTQRGRNKNNNDPDGGDK